MVSTYDAAAVPRYESVVTRIVSAIADRTQTHALDLPPLYDAVDTDVLESVVEGVERSELSFSYHGHDVVVTADESVDVEISEA